MNKCCICGLILNQAVKNDKTFQETLPFILQAHVNNIEVGGNETDLHGEDIIGNRSANIDREPVPPSQTIKIGKTIPDYKEEDYIKIHLDSSIRGMTVVIP